MVLDAQLSSEAQIGAVEADECGGHLLEAVELVDQLVDGKVTVAGEGDDVTIVAVDVGVAGNVGYRLSRGGVCVGSELVESHLAGIISDDLAVFGQQENGKLGVAVLLFRRDI